MRLYDDIILCGERAVARSYAKVNLTLDVLGKRENGYHDVKMIMQTVNLFDLIVVDKEKSGITLKTNIKSLPNGEKNIAWRAAEVFFEHTGIVGGAKILIHKNIPIAAGLAGGSGNAAAVLCALDKLYGTNLSDEELCKIGLSLGADVPYCILGGTQLAEGIGEILTELKPLPKTTFLLVKPNINISTADIYKAIDSSGELSHPNTEKAIEAIEKGDVSAVAKELSNVMESVTAVDCPTICEIKEEMLKMGAVGAQMSGSGPTVFAIFDDYSRARKATENMSKKYAEVFLVKSYN